MKKKIIINVFCFFFAFIAEDQDFGLTHRKTVPYTYSASLSGIWGYTDGQGNEYALVGGSGGLWIVDVSDPDNPIDVKHISAVENQWREVRTWGNYAYLTTEGGGGVQIVNLSSLPDASGVISKQWNPGSIDRIHALHIDNGILYLYGVNGMGGAQFVDLTDPWNPVLIGSYNGTYIHDGMVRDNKLYGGHIYDGYFSIIDVTDKANPVLLQTQNTPNNFTHNTWLSDDSQTLFTTDEVAGSYLAAYDISNINNIQLLDKVRTASGNTVVHNTHVKDDYAFNSWYTDGVVVVDGHRPNNLVIVGQYDTNPLSGGATSGAWGIYPYFSSGTVVVSDMQQGLVILTPTFTRAAYLEGKVTESKCGTDINDVTVKIIAITVQEKTNLSGDYKTGYYQAGTYDVEFSKTGYQTKVVSGVSLVNGNVTSLNVTLDITDFPVNIQQGPEVNLCEGSSTNLSANGASSYTWAPATGLNKTTGSSVSASPSSTITYTVTGLVNGCAYEDTVRVILNSLPLVTLTTEKDTICPDDEFYLVSSGADSYSWSPSSKLKQTSGDTVITKNVKQATTFTVTGTSNGCSAQKTITIFTFPLLYSSVIYQNEICVDSSTIIYADGLLDYTWVPTTGLDTASGPIVIASPIITTTYTVVGIDSFGCLRSIPNLITVRDKPTIEFVTDTFISCKGTPAWVTTNVNGLYDGIQWYPIDGVSNPNNKNSQVMPDSTTTYIIEVQHDQCPSSFDTAVVFVQLLPTITVSLLSDSVCLGDTLAYKAEGAISYSWSPLNKLLQTSGDTAYFIANEVENFSVSGMDTKGCYGNNQFMNHAKSLPSLSVAPQPEATICEGDSILLLASGAASYTWLPNQTLNTDTGDSVIAAPVAITTYTVNGVGANACTNSYVYQVSVNQMPEVVLSTDSTQFCEGDKALINISGAGTYSFLPNEGVSYFGSDDYSFQPDSSMTYMIIGERNACENDTVSAFVEVLSNPSFQPYSTLIRSCKNDTIMIYISSAEENTYTWSPTADLIYSVGDTVLCIPTSSKTYTINAVGANGCTSSEITDVQLYPSYQPSIVLVRNDTLFSSPAQSYQWIKNGSPIAGATDSIYVIQEIAYYQVETIDINGCKSLSDFELAYVGLSEGSEKIFSLVLFPNPFQEVIQFLMSEIVPGAVFEIYDISGKLVYQKMKPALSFTLSKETLNESGIYFYRLLNAEGNVLAGGKMIKQ